MKRAVLSVYYKKHYLGDYSIPVTLYFYKLIEKFNDILLKKNLSDGQYSIAQIYIYTKDSNKLLQQDENLSDVGILDGNIILLT